MTDNKTKTTKCKECGAFVLNKYADRGIELCTRCQKVAVDNFMSKENKRESLDGYDLMIKFVRWAMYYAESEQRDVSVNTLFLLTRSGITIPEKMGAFDEIEEAYRLATSPTQEEALKANAVSWGYVYVMHAPIIDKYKIGYSSNPERRANDLTSSLPSEMKSHLKHKILTDDMPRLEKWFHEVLQEYHHDGEWFSLNDVQLEEIYSFERIMWQTPYHQQWLQSCENTLRTGELPIEFIKQVRKQLKLF